MGSSFSPHSHIYLPPRITNEQAHLNNWVLHREHSLGMFLQGWCVRVRVRACARGSACMPAMYAAIV